MDKEYKPMKFPEDETVYDCIIEWWFLSGHLKDKHGNEYSYMNCPFTADAEKVKTPYLSEVPLKTSHFPHPLVSDINNTSLDFVAGSRIGVTVGRLCCHKRCGTSDKNSGGNRPEVTFGPN